MHNKPHGAGRRRVAFLASGLLASAAVIGAVSASTAMPAFADTTPYPAACGGDLGDFTATGVTTGTLSANPASLGGSETLGDYGLSATIPTATVNSLIASVDSELGEDLPPSDLSLTGQVTTAIDAVGISPATTVESLGFSSATLTTIAPLTITTTPLTTPPAFTDATGDLQVSQDPRISIEVEAVFLGTELPFVFNISCDAPPTVIDSAVIPSAPGAPADVSAAPGNGQLAVSWTAPASSGSAPISGYLVTATTHGGGPVYTKTLNTPATATTLGGLTNGTGYDVTVAAVNSVGTGPAAAAAGNPVTPTSAAPLITSANTLAVAVGHNLSFRVTAVGRPKPDLAEAGAPSWLTFTPAAKGGSATLVGTPPAGAGGQYPITVTATNSSGAPDTQAATLSVLEFTSPDAVSFPLGQSDSFTVTTSLSPVDLALTGSLPPNVSFAVNGDGTATLSGIPAGKAKTYHLTFKATYGAVSCTQAFTITTS